MELKSYQRDVLEDLRQFMEQMQTCKELSGAFAEHWSNKGVPIFSVDHPRGMPPYRNNLPRCPHVCIKVPTAGGKTFIAANALRIIFDAYSELMSRAVVWLVPSTTILEQTERNLRDPAHPYHQRIKAQFNGRFEVFTKGQLLQGAGFSSTAAREQLNILVLSLDSLRSRKKVDRLMFRDNSNYKAFFDEHGAEAPLLDDGKTESLSLVNVIRTLNPVIVIDESHRAVTDLSIETLEALNPSFVLELTATPRDTSNIISIVGANRLKEENMVKLPVIVYNQKNAADVINSALVLQRKLELEAKKQEAETGKYIRPIVLFQAEPRNAEDNQTFEKIKQILVEKGIPESHIAIKTADVDELKNINLLSRECPVRYIITVNALKEGWDCPFAYILATVANRSSQVDVEQILGRVLRLPYVRQHPNNLFNMSYVFTCSSQFKETLDNIIKALNAAGFSERDYRVASEAEPYEAADFASLVNRPGRQGKLFGEESGNAEGENGLEEALKLIQQSGLDTSILQAADEEVEGNPLAKLIEETAKKAFEADAQAREQQNQEQFDPELAAMKNTYPINSHFKAKAEALRLPQFYQKTPKLALFGGAEGEVFFEKEALATKVRLSRLDINIDFEAVDYEIYQIDLDKQGSDYVPRHLKMDNQFNEEFIKYVNELPEEKKIKQIAGKVVRSMGKMPPFREGDLIAYVSRIVEEMDIPRRMELTHNHSYIEKIKRHIRKNTEEFVAEEFQKLLDTGEIFLKETYNLPPSVSPVKTEDGIGKSLYAKEAKGNNFETQVVMKLAGLNNISFWHKIDDRDKKKAFFINGFLNHYPDYLLVTQSGMHVIIETKGDFLDNEDSRRKLRLGRLWESKANVIAGDRYRYFMVFENHPIQDAHTAEQVVEIVRKL